MWAYKWFFRGPPCSLLKSKLTRIVWMILKENYSLFFFLIFQWECLNRFRKNNTHTWWFINLLPKLPGILQKKEQAIARGQPGATKKTFTFHYICGLIGILMLVYFNPLKAFSKHLLTRCLDNQGNNDLSMLMVFSPKVVNLATGKTFFVSSHSFQTSHTHLLGKTSWKKLTAGLTSAVRFTENKHGNLLGPPPIPPPTRNKALLRDY